MDIVVRVGECALDGEDSGVSSLSPRSVIAASVATLGLDVRNREILIDQSLVELGQLVVGEICDNADFLPGTPLDPSGHVELAHSDNIDTAGFVVLCDGLGTQETSLLNTFVSFDRDNTDRKCGRTSAEYQWNSTVRLGLKSDSNKALYASRMVTVPLPSSSAP